MEYKEAICRSRIVQGARSECMAIRTTNDARECIAGATLMEGGHAAIEDPNCWDNPQVKFSLQNGFPG
eukprot:3980634-Pyramimonas_sp.AAC.1